MRESSAYIGDVLTQERTEQLPLVGANVLDLMQVTGTKTGITGVGAFDTDTFTGQYSNTVTGGLRLSGLTIASGRCQKLSEV